LGYDIDLEDHIIEYLVKGGYPGLEAVDFETARDILMERFGLTLHKDIMRIFAVRNIKGLENMILRCAMQSSQLTNYYGFAKSIGIKYDTFMVYLGYLTDVFIVSESRFFSKSDSTFKKGKKLYLRDHATRNLLIGLMNRRLFEFKEEVGKTVETVVQDHACRLVYRLQRRMQCYYWRGKKEVDIVIRVGTVPVPIEVKYLRKIQHEKNIIYIPIKKVGRNEPCPCGSGKKYKKCCFLLLKNLPPKRVLNEDYHHYTTSEHIHRANSSDIILILENLTVLAFEAEGDGDASGAFGLFRILEPLAEQQGMSDKLLEKWGMICCDHSELGEDGLVIMRRLQSLYEDKDRLQWAYTIMDTANYLADMGKLNEGKKEYERIIEQMPDFLQAYIDYANFLGPVFTRAQYHFSINP